MRTLVPVLLAAAASFGAFVLPSGAEAKVHITVDLDHQTIHVEAKDQVFDWKVSSGKSGYETPAGKFGVLWMDKEHHSDEYDGAYMPDAIFFAPGYAIHGFGKSPWGHKASHGCVRLPVAQANILFDLVKAQGAEVNIVGYSPTVLAASPSRRPEVDADMGGYDQDDGQADRVRDQRIQGYPRASRAYGSPAYDDAAGDNGRRGGSDGFYGSLY